MLKKSFSGGLVSFRGFIYRTVRLAPTLLPGGLFVLPGEESATVRSVIVQRCAKQAPSVQQPAGPVGRLGLGWDLQVHCQVF